MSDVQDSARWLADKLRATEATAAEALKVASLPQLASSSIESGQIEEYDNEGTLVAVTGEQFDGTHGSVTYAGPNPPEPVAPDVHRGYGQIQVRWSGKFVDDALSPMDFSHVSVHVSELEAFDPDNETQKATITGESGDVATIMLDAGQWSVALVAVSKAGKWSDMSDVVTVEVAVFDNDALIDQMISVDDALEAVDAKAQAANEAANTADSKAGEASLAASAAATAAANAAGIASGKGKCLIQSTVPGTADQNDVTLWIDTTAGANTPKRWSGSEWVAVTDSVAVKAAADAASALNSATAAAALAGQAMTAAGQAQASASGKNNVYYRTAVPSGTSFTIGDTVFIRDSVSAPITAQKQWDGSEWVDVTMSHQVIASVDLGKATVGQLDGVYIKSRTLEANTLVVRDTTNIYPDPMFRLGLAWLTGATGWVADPALNSGLGAIVYKNTGTGTVYAPRLSDNGILVQGGEKYLVTADVAVTSGTTPNVHMRVWCYNKDNTTTNILAGKALTTANATYATIGGIITVPAGTVRMNPVATFYTPAGTGENLYVTNVRVCRAASSELIVDGAVIAQKLESELVLATKIIAGNPQGTHAKMDPTGFKVLAAVDGGAPAEVIRMGTDTDDYFGVASASGELVASITSGGDITGNSLDVTEDISLAGDSLAGILDAQPKGIIAWASRYTSGKYKAAGTKHPYLHLQVDDIKAGRAYMIRSNTINVSSDAANTNAGVFLHINGPGTAAATVSSTVIDSGKSVQEPWSTGERSTVTFNRLITPSTDGTYSFLLSYGLTGGTAGRCWIAADGSSPVMFTVEDVGLAMAQTGESRDGSGDAPAGGSGGGETAPPVVVKNYSKTYNATGLRSFTGAGATYAYNTGYMYSGQSPSGYGDLSSMAVFPSFTGDLTGATITGVAIYVYYDFWYQGSGGTPYLSWHGQTGLTSTKPAVVAGPASLGNWPRASGKWVQVSSSVWAGLKSGSIRGFMLGGTGGGYERYGYAHNPRIRINYTK